MEQPIIKFKSKKDTKYNYKMPLKKPKSNNFFKQCNNPPKRILKIYQVPKIKCQFPPFLAPLILIRKSEEHKP